MSFSNGFPYENEFASKIPIMLSTANSNLGCIIPLNFNYMEAIYNYYFHEEPLIDESKQNLNDFVFQGGFEISYANGMIPIKFNETEGLKKKEQLVESLDWKRMFGFCAIKKFKNKTTDKMEFEICEFGTGIFVLVFDGKNSNASIKFIPFKRGKTTKDGNKNKGNIRYLQEQSFSTGGIPFENVKFSKNYEVYVWPGLKPSQYNGLFKTVGAKLLKKYTMLQTWERYLMTAEEINSMPMTIIRKTPQKFDITDMTESEIYGDDDIEDVAPDDAKKYKRDTFSAKMMERKVEELNSNRSTNRNNNFLSFNLKNGNFDLKRKRNIMESDNIFNLNEGEQIDRQLLATSNPIYVQIKKDYEELVSRSMGLNKEMMGKSSKLKVNAEQGKETLEASVRDERNSVASFYQWCYEFLYREQDNKKFAALLSSLDQEEKELQEFKKFQQFDESNSISQDSKNPAPDNPEQKLKQVRFNKKMFQELAESKYLVSLTFAKDPFAKSIPNEDVQNALNQRVLTPLEEINLLRTKTGLDKVSADHILVKEREQLRDAEIRAKKQELLLIEKQKPDSETTTNSSSTGGATKKKKPKIKKMDDNK